MEETTLTPEEQEFFDGAAAEAEVEADAEM